MPSKEKVLSVGSSKHDDTKRNKKHYIESENSDEEDNASSYNDCLEVDPIEVINSMPVRQRRQIYALKGILKDFRELHEKFRDEMASLELAQLKELQPLFDERRKIVTGERDIMSHEEARAKEESQKVSGVEEIGSSDDEDENNNKNNGKKDVKIVTSEDAIAKDALEAAALKADGGIPSFWLNAIKHNETLENMVTEHDTPVLMHLIDITKSYINEDPRTGFTLNFHFAPNKYFSDTILTKRYLYDKDDKDSDEPLLEHIEGCEINWTSPANNVTVTLKQKKQRHKGGMGVRVVTREEKCPSFFNFFTAPDDSAADDKNDKNEHSDDEEDDIEEQMEMDYDAAVVFAESIIPHAAHYYSGKNVEELARMLNFLKGAGDEVEEAEDGKTLIKKNTGGKQVDKKGGNPGGEEKDCKQQ